MSAPDLERAAVLDGPGTAALDRARAVADAVLYEGYLLYPYRASADKNQVRWQFGVLMPPALADPDTGEYDASRTECLAEPREGSVLTVRLRFLHLQARTMLGLDGGPVEELVVDGTALRAWDEAVERHVDVAVTLADVLGGPRTVPFDIDGGEDVEPVLDDAGAQVGRAVRRRWPLHGEIVVGAEPLTGPYGGVRLRVEVRNVSDWRSDRPERAEALRHALIGAHTLLALTGGEFLSLTEPPEWAAPAAAACVNERSWPVLVGEPGERDLMLSAPIILYDYPSIAPESTTPLYDGTEIDEILTLRTMALTDEEKREVRATDPRARELLDAVDGMPPELLDRLHGTVRYLRDVTGASARPDAEADVPWWDATADAAVDPDTDAVTVAGVRLSRGSPVRLRPRHGTDAQDMFLEGLDATVQAVVSDVDGGWHLAVTVDDDPAAEMQNEQGRYRYFGLDEVEPRESGT
ncbi:MAG: hypothetical protein WCA46_31385 [Actinocatenispora sp.]